MLTPFTTSCDRPADPRTYHFARQVYSDWSTLSERTKEALSREAVKLLDNGTSPRFFTGRNGQSGEAGSASLHRLAYAELSSRNATWLSVTRYHEKHCTICSVPRNGAHHIQAVWRNDEGVFVHSFQRRAGVELADLRWQGGHCRMLGKTLYHEAVEQGLYSRFARIPVLPGEKRALNQTTALHEFIIFAGWYLDDQRPQELPIIGPRMMERWGVACEILGEVC